MNKIQITAMMAVTGRDFKDLTQEKNLSETDKTVTYHGKHHGHPKKEQKIPVAE